MAAGIEPKTIASIFKSGEDRKFAWQVWKELGEK